MRYKLFIRLFFVSVFLMAATALMAQDPGIEITDVPEWGSSDFLRGRVWEVDPSEYKVAVYLYFEGWWWPKPYTTAPLTSIQPDCTWLCNVATGANDHYATRYTVFLVPEDFVPPVSGYPYNEWRRYLPDTLYTNYPYDVECRLPGTRVISFSGYNWVVKQCDTRIGPGDPQGNYFSDNVNDVWVDSLTGELHLKISYRNSKWYCTEVIADTSLGYGKYVFYIKSNVDSFDRNVVLGLFTWDEWAPPDSIPPYHYREMDIEFSRWAIPVTELNAQYVIQPYDTAGNRYQWAMSSDTCTTHTFAWREDAIFFQSSRGYSITPSPEDVIESWTYTGSYNPSPGRENPRINCWLYGGTAPSNQQEVEVVIGGFEYFPQSIKDLTITRVEPNVILTWGEVADAIGYNVYASSDPDLIPDISNFLGFSSGGSYLDMNVLSHGEPTLRFYRVTVIFP
jgi:hypothetical protein